MKNILNLTKIYFKENLANMGNAKKSAKSRNIGFMLLIFAIVGISLGYNFYMIAEMLDAMGSAANILLIGLMMSVFVVLVMTISSTQGYYYQTKDYEMLSALPITTLEIIVAKYMSSYLTTFLYTAMFAIPTFVVYFLFCPITVLSVLFACIGLFILPVFCQLLGSVFSWIVSVISAKMPNKNIMRSIISIVFTLMIMFFVYFSNSEVMVGMFAGAYPVWAKIVFSQIYFLQKAITGSYLYFLAFVGISSVFALISVWIISIGYRAINTSFHTNSSKKGKIVYKKSSVLSTLVKKDAHTFVLSPVYFMNGIIGPILTLVLVFIMYNIYKDIPSMPLVADIFCVIQCFMVPLCIGIAPTTAVSISMEGTKFLTLKSLPVKYKDIVLSKVLLNIILNLPFVVVGHILFGVMFSISWQLMSLIMGISIVSLILYSVFGLLINLKFPKLRWTSEAQAVKQSASMLIVMLVDMIIAFLPAILYFVFIEQISTIALWIYLLIVLGVLLILTITMCILLAKIGKKLYRKII